MWNWLNTWIIVKQTDLMFHIHLFSYSIILYLSCTMCQFLLSVLYTHINSWERCLVKKWPQSIQGQKDVGKNVWYFGRVEWFAAFSFSDLSGCLFYSFYKCINEHVCEISWGNKTLIIQITTTALLIARNVIERICLYPLAADQHS